MSTLPDPSTDPNIYTIYGIDGCGYTKKARKLLPSANYVNIENYMTRLDFQYKMRPRIGNFLTVPVIFKGQTFIGGYNELSKMF